MTTTRAITNNSDTNGDNDSNDNDDNDGNGNDGNTENDKTAAVARNTRNANRNCNNDKTGHYRQQRR